MSWHYLQEPAEEFSVDTYLDGIRSARLKLKNTPARYSSPDSVTASSQPSPFGTMSAPSTADRGEALSMLSPAAFLVKISAPQAVEPESPANAPACGGRCLESFARFDPVSRSWRTRQCLLLGDLEPYLETWPKQGSMRNGWCSERTPWEPPTGATAFGSSRHLIPTPTACNAPNSGSNTKGPKSLLEVAQTGWKPGQLWPTPTASDWKRAGESLTTCLFRVNNNKQISLPNAVKLATFPRQPAEGIDGGSGARTLLQQTAPEDANQMLGGQLNPTWVEWLMGWPIKWTDLKPLAMDKFLLWQLLHSSSLNDV